MQTENILDLTGSVIASKRFSPPESDENTNANQYYFYHYDVRGSVTNIIDPTGARVKGYSYNEFGNITDSTQNDFLKKQ